MFWGKGCPKTLGMEMGGEAWSCSDFQSLQALGQRLVWETELKKPNPEHPVIFTATNLTLLVPLPFHLMNHLHSFQEHL